MSKTWEIKGLKELQTKLRILPQICNDAAKEALDYSLEKMAEKAKQYAPFDTGQLQNNIRVMHPRKTRGANTVEGSIKVDPVTSTPHTVDAYKKYDNTNYAPMAEFGTGAVGAGTNHPWKGKLGVTYTSKAWTFPIPGKDIWVYKYKGYRGYMFMYRAYKSTRKNINRDVVKRERAAIRKGMGKK